jgi:hypothetical protein
MSAAELSKGSAAARAAGSAPLSAPSGWPVWLAVFGTIPVWIAHLVAEASLAPLREQHRGVVWVMHAVTVVLAVVVLAAMRRCWSLARIAAEAESAPSPAGRTVFLGLLGLTIGALDLLLIIYEGALVVAMRQSR